MAQSGHIFISYARADAHGYAEKFYDELIQRGMSAWRDVRNIDPYQDFSAELEKAIENASHVVVCITPDTKRENSFVRREIGYALGLGKPVIPLRFANILPPISIVTIPYIDFGSTGIPRR